MYFLLLRVGTFSKWYKSGEHVCTQKVHVRDMVSFYLPQKLKLST